MGDGCRLVLQERIRPAFEDATFDIDGQTCALGIQNNLNVLAFQAFTNVEGLTEQVNLAMHGHLPNKSYATCCDWQGFGWHNKTWRQHLKFLASSILFGRQAAQFALHML